jgi:hypothetical protein
MVRYRTMEGRLTDEGIENSKGRTRRRSIELATGLYKHVKALLFGDLIISPRRVHRDVIISTVTNLAAFDGPKPLARISQLAVIILKHSCTRDVVRPGRLIDNSGSTKLKCIHVNLKQSVWKHATEPQGLDALVANGIREFDHEHVVWIAEVDSA